jgi:hypothetical protein
VRLVFEDGASSKSFPGSVSMVSFGSDQYVWRSEGVNSHPDPNTPPVRKTVQGNWIELPKASLTVLRGKLDVTK